MDKPSFFERLSNLLLREPEDREQLIRLLHSAHERDLLDADALSITEGALAASEISVRETMGPRSLMKIVDIGDPPDKIIRYVNETAHSRFPVVDGNRENVIGVLLAKDLLRMQGERHFFLRDCIRPAVFIPESKRLNVLLREFRVSRQHMAIVVDEYAGIRGLITIEDVLEQIVGDIEDEYDLDDDEDNIRLDHAGRYRIKAQTSIDDLNNRLGTEFRSEGYHTVSGLILNHLGRVPRRKEVIEIEGIRFVVLRADRRRLYTLQASLAEPTDGAD